MIGLYLYLMLAMYTSIITVCVICVLEEATHVDSYRDVITPVEPILCGANRYVGCRGVGD